METTRDERDRGILIISAMTLKDFLTLIDRKIEEFEDKAAKYLDDCHEDLNQVTDMPEHEIQICVKYHEASIQKYREMLVEFKKISEKNLDDNHMVPRQMVELCVDLARKVTSIRYTKVAPSLVRVN